MRCVNALPSENSQKFLFLYRKWQKRARERQGRKNSKLATKCARVKGISHQSWTNITINITVFPWQIFLFSFASRRHTANIFNRIRMTRPKQKQKMRTENSFCMRKRRSCHFEFGIMMSDWNFIGFSFSFLVTALSFAIHSFNLRTFRRHSEAKWNVVRRETLGAISTQHRPTEINAFNIQMKCCVNFTAFRVLFARSRCNGRLMENKEEQNGNEGSSR